jgi:hypothetical protein
MICPPELDEARRLLRLRQIYRDQGIGAGPVLADGVKAPRQPLRLHAAAGKLEAHLSRWTKRETHGKRLGVALAVLIAVSGSYHVLVRGRPSWRRTGALETIETLPALRQRTPMSWPSPAMMPPSVAQHYWPMASGQPSPRPSRHEQDNESECIAMS